MNDNNNNNNFSPARSDPAAFRQERPQGNAGHPLLHPIPEAGMRLQQWQTTSVPKGDPATSWVGHLQGPAGPPPSYMTPGPDMRFQQRQNIPLQNAPFAPSSPVPDSRKPKKRPFLLIVSLLILLILLGGVVFAMWEFTNSTPDVTVYQVGSQNVIQDIGGGGIIFPRQQLDISYPTSELVKAVLVKAGDQVTPKQSLIQLDASQLNIQVQQAASDMAAAQATLNSVAASGNALQIAQAQQTYQLAKDRYDALVAQAQSPTLHNGDLISPMSGVITAVNVNPGAVIVANVPLITIMDESIAIVHAKIPLSNLGQVHLGQQATVTPSALPGLTVQGVVSSIIPQADPQTDTFEVWVSVINTNRMLLPGMSAFVHIKSASKALVVPRLAVLNPESSAEVFVVQNLYAHIQRVQVAGRTADSIFIGQGLKEGDKVVLVGIDRLQDGERVSVTRVEQNMAAV